LFLLFLVDLFLYQRRLKYNILAHRASTVRISTFSRTELLTCRTELLTTVSAIALCVKIFAILVFMMGTNKAINEHRVLVMLNHFFINCHTANILIYYTYNAQFTACLKNIYICILFVVLNGFKNFKKI
jgi:hypothetical protein